MILLLLISLLFPWSHALSSLKFVSTLSDHYNQDPDFARHTSEIRKLTTFFVKAFWESKKIEHYGGDKTMKLTPEQQKYLEFRQFVDFMERYDVSRLGKESQVLLIRNDDDNNNPEIVACAGIEFATLQRPLPNNGLPFLEKHQDPGRARPVMGDLAVSCSYREKGLAKLLVETAEAYVAKTWPDQTSCYLWVEQGNDAALKLYRNSGYEIIWTEPDAITYVSLDEEHLNRVPTTFVCMQKNISTVIC
mmetsp:Transcript_18906/g.24321  ORF Transcript_18906/g.24321 Transcript_18906/m.24321 type:complete len:248 (-) Transcript_18906:234-977(-)